MSCDYPCHICDHEEWAEETKSPPYDFDAAYERASSAVDKAFTQEYPYSLSWWVPMEGWPEDVTIREERDIEDLSYGGWKSTMLMDSRLYMEKPRIGWQAGVDSFRIISCMQKILDWDKGTSYIAAVQSRTPPPWGWWMPTLNPGA